MHPEIRFDRDIRTRPQIRVDRRYFLRRAAMGVVAPLIVPGTVLGLNGAVAPGNRINFGVIGIGPRARGILPNFLSFRELHFRAVSDCREDRLREAKKLIDTHYANEDCLAYPDFRDLLGRKDVDAVLI